MKLAAAACSVRGSLASKLLKEGGKPAKQEAPSEARRDLIHVGVATVELPKRLHKERGTLRSQGPADERWAKLWHCDE